MVSDFDCFAGSGGGGEIFGYLIDSQLFDEKFHPPTTDPNHTNTTKMA